MDEDTRNDLLWRKVQATLPNVRIENEEGKKDGRGDAKHTKVGGECQVYVWMELRPAIDIIFKSHHS